MGTILLIVLVLLLLGALPSWPYSRNFMKLILTAALLAACCAAQAQVTPPELAARQRQEIRHGDPARWYQADRTKAAQLRTLRKEITAAYVEARTACKQVTADERSDCLKDAKEYYTADMGNLEGLRYAANHMGREVYDTTGR